MSVFKKFFALFSVLTLTQSCRNYESDEYKREEHAAYQQLISEFTKIGLLPEFYVSSDVKPTLYIVSELENTVNIQPQFTEVFQEETIQEETIQEGGVSEDISYEVAPAPKSQEEYKHFRPMLLESLDKRLLTGTMEHDSLIVKLIFRKEYEGLTTDGLNSEFVKNPELFGYLFLSRIVFNKDYTVGYLNFSFYCGVGCFWTNNVEIRIVDGKWTITEFYSGSIA